MLKTFDGIEPNWWGPLKEYDPKMARSLIELTQMLGSFMELDPI